MRFGQGDGAQPGSACCEPYNSKKKKKSVCREQDVLGDVTVAVHLLSLIDVLADLGGCLICFKFFSRRKTILQTLLAEIMLCPLLSPSL